MKILIWLVKKVRKGAYMGSRYKMEQEQRRREGKKKVGQPTKSSRVPVSSTSEERLEIGPNSKAQVDFFMSSESEVLYGGSAGGGKSMALVMDPMRYIGYGEFTGIIFRRTFPELEGSILPHTMKLYPHAGGSYNTTSKTWTFPSGAKIRLGFMQYENDWMNYQGSEYAYQAFDELTTFLYKQFEIMRVWNRSKVAGIPPYRRMSSNPGGVSHAAVKQAFVDPCRPVNDGPQVFSEMAQVFWQPVKAGQTFKYVDKETGAVITRRFIPARVFDNEDLLRNNPGYVQALMTLPTYRRKAFLEGDWDVFEGQFFGMWNSSVHVKPALTKKIPDVYKKSAGLDYGQTTVLEAAYCNFEGTIVNFLEVYTREEAPEERANKIADALIDYDLKRLKIFYDTTMKITMVGYMQSSKSPLQIFRQVFKERMGDNAPNMVAVTKKSIDNVRYRVVCNEVVKNHLNWKSDTDGKVIQQPKLLVTENCQHLIKTLPELVHDPDSYRGLDFNQDQGEDDPFDAMKYNIMGLRVPKKETPDRPKQWYEQVGLPSAVKQDVYDWRDPYRV